MEQNTHGAVTGRLGAGVVADSVRWVRFRPPVEMRSLDWRPSDPGRYALRNAIRAALVVPVVLAIGRAVGNDQTALFGVFGAIALLVFVDFGGPAGARLFAYLALAVVGAALIAVGTLCSTEPILAAVTMAVSGFAILFAGVINGYLAAAGSAALLAYILPAMVPASASEVPSRILGWALAGVVAIPAVMLLFPGRPRDRLRDEIATACGALARLVADPSHETEVGATRALDAVHRQFSSTPYRPTGPTGATGALADMIDELDWLRSLATALVGSDTRDRPLASERALRELSAATLASCAALIDGRGRPRLDREALERGRIAVIDDLLLELSDPAVQHDDDRLWAAIVNDWTARVTSYAALDVARYATIAAGLSEEREGGPAWLAFIRRQSIGLTASGRVMVAHVGVRSVWFRNSLRGAVGLSLAVLVAQVVSLQHAFWAVLGALSVLRSSALSTGATVLRAAVGTLIGIVVGGVLLVCIGTDTILLWLVLPIACLLAAYAPRAISFAAGQAGFTVAVFVVFDIIEPTGLQVGLVRLEDVSIGFGISLLVGVLFWPRGAATVLRSSLAVALATSAGYTAAAMRGVLVGGATGELVALEADTVAAQNRLDAAIRQRIAERPSADPRTAEVSRLVTATARIRRTADALRTLAEQIGDTPRPQTTAYLLSEVEALRAWYVAFGQSVDSRADLPRPEALDPLEHATLLSAVRDSAAHGQPTTTIAALACTWVGLHLDELRRLEARVAQTAVLLREPPVGHPGRPRVA